MSEEQGSFQPLVTKGMGRDVVYQASLVYRWGLLFAASVSVLLSRGRHVKIKNKTKSLDLYSSF